jgi:hypothetical protein
MTEENKNELSGFQKLSVLADDQTNQENSAPSESNEQSEEDNQGPDELTLLKQRARLMGVQFSNNIGIDSLKARIAEHLEKSNSSSEEKDDEGEQDNNLNQDPTPAPKPVRTKAQAAGDLRKQVQAENMRLIRLRITNLDPKKANLPGEIFTVANEYLGTVRKYVPFGEQTDNGYHVPYCIYKQLKNRKFLSIKVRRVNGREVVDSQWVKEFSLDILPPLTEAELAKLGAAQSAAGGLE